MHCITNKHLSKSDKVKSIFDQIISKIADKEPAYQPFMKKWLEEILAKFATGKDFSEDEKNTLISFGLTMNLSDYISEELLVTLLKEASPYVIKEKDIYRFDANRIIQNQEKSRTTLDKEYIQMLLSDYPYLPDINRKRLEYIITALDRFWHGDDSTLYQEDIQIRSNNLYIRDILLPIDQKSNPSTNFIIYADHQSLYKVLSFVAKLMKIDLSIPKELEKEKELLSNSSDEIWNLVDKLQSELDNKALQSQLEEKKQQYKNHIRNISDRFVRQHTVSLWEAAESNSYSLLDVLKDIIQHECKIPYQPAYKGHTICISLFRYPWFSLISEDGGAFREYYLFD